MRSSSTRLIKVLALLVTTAKAQTTAPLTFAQTGVPQTAAPVQTAVPQVAAATGVPQTAAPVAATAATTAPDDGWSGCVDPSEPDALIRIGKKTTICVVLASNTNWNAGALPGNPPVRYLRLSWQPQADEYSRFHVPSSYQDLIATQATSVFDGTNNVTLHVASQQVLSFQRVFYTPNAGSGRVFPYLTAIIDVKKGVVAGITWDNACLFCNDDVCLEDTYDFNGNQGNQEEFKQPTKGCYITQPECATYMLDDQPRCDITVFVVWTGDDADGRALQSSAFRFSAFPEQEISNRVADLVPDFDIPFVGGDEAGDTGARV